MPSTLPGRSSAHLPKIATGNHPDLHVYAPEGKSDLHPIASIHQIINEMALPPFEAKNKVFVIEDAENAPVWKQRPPENPRGTQ